MSEDPDGARSGPVAWVNGRLLPAGAPALPVADRAFQLGDGVFETLRVRRGVPIELDGHLRRLHAGLDTLTIRLDWSDAEIAAAIAETVARNAPADAAGRVTVSRGAPESRGLLPAGWRDAHATLVIQAWPNAGVPAQVLERGLRAIVSTARRDPSSPLAGVKTVSRAEYVWAKLEADRAGVDDASSLTLDGGVAEATTASPIPPTTAAPMLHQPGSYATPGPDPNATRRIPATTPAATSSSTTAARCSNPRRGEERRSISLLRAWVRT